ncbi:hypothetical protein [Reyranella sp.]|uniref:hypothetical protein n=1 Tax=Reyranella sp. TaxID=1929291 RepID=UPI00268309D1|nr:hypothetical protein [Reyranella sp.]
MPVVKLSFGGLVAQSFGFVFANLGLFFHLVTIPWIASLAIRLLGSTMPRDSLMPMLIEKAVDIVPTVMFMVAWQRVVLLGPNRVGRLPGLGWSPRETAFLLHLIKIGGFTFVLLAAFVLTLGNIDPEMLAAGAAIDPEVARKQALAAPIGAGFTVSIILALRISYGLAATAVDEPFSPRLSWTHSRGNAWTIIGVLFLIFLTGALATTMATLVVLGLVRGVLGAADSAAIITWTAAILVSYGGTAVAATAQALIFRDLLGWREGAPLRALSS